ncbi:MAG: hypothetical protein CME38_14385 [Haliea sp.]|nr:hypothetical protein [Haliea sp.]
MDETDTLILSQLQANGRLSNRVIARSLGVPERQIATRIRDMLAADDMRILLVADLFAAGFEHVLFIGVEVAGRPARAVAEELAALPEVISVMLSMGSEDIELVMVAENHARLVSVALEYLSRIPGIRRHTLSLGLSILKYSTEMGPLVPGPPSGEMIAIPEGGAMDRLDREIVNRLWIDPRMTNQRVASELAISESAVRARLQSLRERNVVHITAMRNMRMESGSVFASIGVEVAGREVETVAAELAALPETGFVAIVLGRYDILVMGLLGNPGELERLLAERIEPLSGVSKVHTSQVLGFVKYDVRWTALGVANAVGVPPSSKESAC